MNDVLRLQDLLTREEALLPELEASLIERNGIHFLHNDLIILPFYNKQLNAYANSLYEQKRKMLEDASHKKDWHRWVFTHERAYRWDALLSIMHQLQHKEFGELFSDVWTDSENIWQHERQIRRALSFRQPSFSFMMDDDEQARYDALPDIVTIYRGHHRDENEAGMSWTLDRSVAEWFARRLCSAKHTPRVVTAQTHKSNIVAYLKGRGEQEVIIWHPENITNKTTEALS